MSGSRPQLGRGPVGGLLGAKLLAAGLARDGYPVALLGVRGYFLRSMGDPSHNDRGIYDDAIFVHAPDAYVGFRANCDPSVRRARIANLAEGVWLYKLGTHGLSKPLAQQYRALVQARPVVVHRDGVATPERGYFGINIHRGGVNGTSSLGCQTIPRPEWPGFIALVETLLDRHGQATVPYVLVESTLKQPVEMLAAAAAKPEGRAA